MRVGEVGEDTGARKKGGERVGFCAETAQSGFADARRARSSLQTSGETVGGATRGGGGGDGPRAPGGLQTARGPDYEWLPDVGIVCVSGFSLACSARVCLRTATVLGTVGAPETSGGMNDMKA